ncbi:ABC transporter ATP-binding protein [Methylomonas sp. HW2-6]|uniref:ABC transporter ATP-binding protein n=1 Tax=Methylomonas sp. HW2-6 TaxID=3376687 RepID=UPI0040417448
MNIAIKVNDIGKKYQLLHEKKTRYNTLGGELSHGIKSLTQNLLNPFHKKSEITISQELWALKNVNFDIKHGERFGIIGRNGAGKSTLLKILSGITAPTTGSVTIYGRMASLLEIGTGFHPELTGRENIFLNGAVLGMKKKEIQMKFDAIVDFAEVENFLDTPVKHYSSGMYVRLAFAIAANLEPEILIVDEVLAVGDIQFQRKCLGKMDEFGHQGRTLIFVSHNMGMMSSLCTKGILLDSGNLTYQGQISEAIIQYYKKLNIRHENEIKEFSSPNARLLDGKIMGSSGTTDILITSTVIIRMTYELIKQVNGKCVPNFHFFTSDGSYLFVSTPEGIMAMSPGKYHAECEIPANLLNDGVYFVGLALTTHYDNGSYIVEFFDKNALIFNIIDPIDENPSRYCYTGPIPGTMRPRLNWRIYSI